MKNVLLIRHMDKEEPVPSALYGLTDLPLKDDAYKKFIEVKNSLSQLSVEKVLCSPLKRCRQTAQYYFPEAELDILDDAKEVDFGDWEGMTFDQIKSDFPEEVNHWAEDENFVFPGGESLAAFRRRVESLVSYISQQEESTIVLVTHGGVIRILLCQVLGLELRNSSAFKLDQGLINFVELFDNGLGVLNKINDFGDERWLKLL